MTLPVPTQTWSIDPNHRANFVSVIDATQQVFYNVKNWLVTHGYTVVWSASGGTGPTNAADHTDRITSAATWTPRATIAAASQAWIVLLDGNGVQILLTFQGASDDICRISFSPGALFALAGTTNQQPTATDEQVVVSGTTIVNATASADRVYDIWVNSTATMFRVIVYRSSLPQSFWGVEKMTSQVVLPATFSPPVWGFFYGNTSTNYQFASTSNSIMSSGSVNTVGGVAKVHTSVDVSCLVGGSGEAFGSIGGFGGTFWTVEKPELQGSANEILLPMGCMSNTANANGKLGNRIDWWAALTNNAAVPAHGDTFGALQFLALGALIMPWDGVTTPVIA